jgi:hypothetical protein
MADKQLQAKIDEWLKWDKVSCNKSLIRQQNLINKLILKLN